MRQEVKLCQAETRRRASKPNPRAHSTPVHQPGPDGHGARLDPRRVASAQTCPAGPHPQVEPGGCRRLTPWRGAAPPREESFQNSGIFARKFKNFRNFQHFLKYRLGEIPIKCHQNLSKNHRKELKNNEILQNLPENAKTFDETFLKY